MWGYRFDSELNVWLRGQIDDMISGKKPICYDRGHEYGSGIITALHANEPVTESGKLRPSSRTAALMKQLKAPAYLGISGRTLEFDGKGKCVAGC